MATPKKKVKNRTNISIRLPAGLANIKMQNAASKRAWTRNRYIQIAVGEKLVRDGVISEAEFSILFKCSFKDVASGGAN